MLCMAAYVVLLAPARLSLCQAFKVQTHGCTGCKGAGHVPLRLQAAGVFPVGLSMV